MDLRQGYQQDGLNAILNAFKEHNSLLVVMPTGTGKTVLLSHVVKKARKGRCLVIAHREELIHQTAGTLRKLGLEVGVEMADRRANSAWWSPPEVVVGTIQTLTANECSRLKELVDEPGEWSLTIVDEAHHAPAETYRRLIKHMQKNPNHKLLGVTATPDRADELAMGAVFDHVAYEYRINDAIQDGWLTPIRQTCVRISGLTYEKVRTTAGDLNGADLSLIMTEERTAQAMVSAALDIAADRKSVFFTVSVDQAKLVTNILNRYKMDCARFVDGKTPRPERRIVFSDFESGKFQFLVNCMITTEGWDSPGVQCVIVGRPTKSRALYTQMVGRGLRPYFGTEGSPASGDSPEERRAAIDQSGKPYCEVIDFVGNSGRHKLITTMDILGGKFPPEVRELAALRAADAPELLDPDVALEEAAELLRLKAEEEARRDAARRASLKAKAEFTTRQFNPFDVLDVVPDVTRSEERSTVKQIEWLQRYKIDAQGMSKREAGSLQREIIRRFKTGMCTINQARVLKEHGHRTDLSKSEASLILDELSANGWKKK